MFNKWLQLINLSQAATNSYMLAELEPFDMSSEQVIIGRTDGEFSDRLKLVWKREAVRPLCHRSLELWQFSAHCLAQSHQLKSIPYPSDGFVWSQQSIINNTDPVEVFWHHRKHKLRSWRFGFVEIDQQLLLVQYIDNHR